MTNMTSIINTKMIVENVKKLILAGEISLILGYFCFSFHWWQTQSFVNKRRIDFIYTDGRAHGMIQNTFNSLFPSVKMTGTNDNRRSIFSIKLPVELKIEISNRNERILWRIVGELTKNYQWKEYILKLRNNLQIMKWYIIIG